MSMCPIFTAYISVIMDFEETWWACLVEGFNTLATAGVLNLPDKRVNSGCWLRSGFESQRRQLVVSLF